MKIRTKTVRFSTPAASAEEQRSRRNTYAREPRGSKDHMPQQVEQKNTQDLKPYNSQVNVSNF